MVAQGNAERATAVENAEFWPLKKKIIKSTNTKNGYIHRVARPKQIVFCQKWLDTGAPTHMWNLESLPFYCDFFFYSSSRLHITGTRKMAQTTRICSRINIFVVRKIRRNILGIVSQNVTTYGEISAKTKISTCKEHKYEATVNN